MRTCFLTAIIVLLAACSSQNKKGPIYPELASSLPKILEIAIVVDDYAIKDYKVIDQYASDIEFGQRFSDGHTIVMSFYPVPRDGQYWLANIPAIQSGAVTVEAVLHSEPNQLSQGILPPDKVTLDITIRNKEVWRHHVENARDETVGLNFDKPLIVDGERFGIVTSKMFPKERWIFRFPKSDGRFSLIVQRDRSS